ncbi:MAG: AsmA family protein [Bacteroidales bacterium]|jgi:hypothetical protein|nr:AsmA family protein [Bacteroidales bacterium]
MKKFLKIFFISLGTLLLLAFIAAGIVSWLIFTPEKLTPIVRKQAAEYINCKSEIGEVEITFFSTFPRFGLRANKLILVNPVYGAPNDTLVNLKEITGVINIESLVKNRELVVNDFRLSGGNICAYIDSNGHANFDIFGNSSPEQDTAQTDLVFKIIDIENIDLKNISILYIDETMNLKADARRLSANINGSMTTNDIVGVIDAKPFGLALEYGTGTSSVLETEIHMSAKVSGSLKSGTLNVDAAVNSLDGILHYGSDSLTFDMGIKNMSAVVNGSAHGDSISGKISMEPCEVMFQLGNEKYLQDAVVGLNIVADAMLSRQFVMLKEVSLSVNDLKLDVAGTIENDTVQKLVATNLSYKFSSWPVKSIMALVPPSFSSYTEGVAADGNLYSEGTVKGVYSQSSMPLIDLRVLLENGTLQYSDFPVPLTAVNADVNIHTDFKDPQSYVSINSLDAKTPQSSIKTTGRITNLFSDMHLHLNTDVSVLLSEFAPMIPDSMKITANGKVSGNMETEFSMSQIENVELEKIKTSGTFTLSGLDIVYDSLSVKTGLSTVEFALPNPKASTGNTNFVFADITTNNLSANKTNSFSASLQNAEISFESSDVRDTSKIPDILCSFNINTLNAQMDSMNVSIVQPSGNIAIAPRKNMAGEPEIRLTYNSGRIDALFGEYSALIEKLNLDINAEKDSAQKDNMLLQWNPRGFMAIETGTVTMASLSYPVEIPEIKMRFDPETVNIEKGAANINQSDFNLSGKLTNVSSYIKGDSLLMGEFSFASGVTDILQLMNITNGIGYSDEEQDEIAGNSSSTFLVPKGMDITLHTNINNATYGGNITASNINGYVRVYNGTLVLDEISFTMPAARMELTAMYRTPRENHLFMGLNMRMLNIEIAELLQMIPAIDTMMPMLRSFGGEGEFRFAGELYTDSLYNVKMSTIRASSSIRGNDLVLMDGETFGRIARTLRFRKQTENKIDSLSAEFTIFRNEVDIYPFLIVMDKYKAVVGGRHYLNMNFDYNISLVESPLPIRLAVGVKGTPDKMRFRLSRSKYANFYRPASRRIVENKEMELRQLIRSALTGENTE